MMEIIALKIAGGLPHILTERTKENEENRKDSSISLISSWEVNHIERSIPYSRRSIERNRDSSENDYLHGAERTYQSGGCHSSE